MKNIKLLIIQKLSQMKNIKLTLLGTAALLIAVGLNIRHALNDYGVRDNKLHVEVLAQSNGSGGGGSNSGGSGSSSDGVNSCPLATYIRNAKPAWETVRVQDGAHCNLGLFVVTLGKRTVANVTLNVNVGGTIRVPECPDSPGNCCEKSHINKSPRYL
ncbi:MAG: hypothetical protein BGO29_13850 [Bacteroidales bacterium 36-12]|nr:MAG: hypothetical protein BGO29_13850 [Bacteroidales bacterium 36-12]